MEQSKTPALSLILCSRNDQYMGNSRWRLETALKYVAERVHELGREEDVEVLVADWGSEVPLREVLQLSPVAASIVSFLHVPPEVAQTLQKDSVFPEVLALNAAARRARGQYIGRIDQDTLVGSRFLKVMLEMHEREQKGPEDSSVFFANVRMIPYRFAVRCPPLSVVEWLIKWFGSLLQVENAGSGTPFYTARVGIFLLRKSAWHDCGGYDERMIYMNAMETNMVRRLMMKYKLVNLGELLDFDFYHLEHYHPRAIRKPASHRMVNPHLPFSRPEVFSPNDKEWGLYQHRLDVLPMDSVGPQPRARHSQMFELSLFAPQLFFLCLQMIFDALVNAWSTLRHRTRVVGETVAGQSVITWPRLLRKRWVERKSAHIQSISDTRRPIER
jgi:hypothetical protein